MVLGKDQIHLYFSHPDQITDSGLLRRYKSFLSGDETQRLSRFHFDRNRHQYLVSRSLLRTTLSAYWPMEPAQWRFGKNAYGKPEISNPDIGLPIRFNLSHTSGLSVLAIMLAHDIGVDLEDSRRNVNAGFQSLASYFSPIEVEELCHLPKEQQRLRFFDYWTLKEAYIKARGAGFAIPLDKFSFLFKANRFRGFETHPDLQDRAENWQFFRMQMADHYRVALAFHSKEGGFKVTAVDSVPLQGNVPVLLKFL